MQMVESHMESTGLDLRANPTRCQQELASSKEHRQKFDNHITCFGRAWTLPLGLTEPNSQKTVDTYQEHGQAPIGLVHETFRKNPLKEGLGLARLVLRGRAHAPTGGYFPGATLSQIAHSMAQAN